MAFEYIVNGRVVKLPVNPNKVAVRFNENLPSPQRKSVIDDKPEVGYFEDRLEVPNETLTIVDVSAAADTPSRRVANAVGALTSDPDVEQALPVFDLGSRQAVPTDRVIVGFKPQPNVKPAEIIQQVGSEILEKRSTNEYLIKLGPASNPFDVINSLMKRAEVEYAEPDFVTIGKHIARPETPNVEGNGSGNGGPSTPSNLGSILEGLGGVVGTATTVTTGAPTTAPATGPAAVGNDPLLGRQYAVTITKANEAWSLITPATNIKIAVLDEGVDTLHPDLANAIVGTYDAIDRDTDQQPNSWDGHGTSCAGLAAAIGDNGIGIRGIAGGCSILAIRIAHSPAPGGDWVTTSSQISDAIDWAWKNGADVLSNSWGGGAPSNAITNAFERARTQGRDGLGCVILIAASNDDGPVAFPATLPNVLCITASNEFDEPKTKMSADGETWWGSCFGPEADLAAPGVHNYTTDISGAGGYNTGGALDADYFARFNGTSSATPIAAGVAALVLSVNPDLRESAVRRIMMESADKVGTVVYVNGRNDRMGHGRVNALNAVQLASLSF